MAQRNTKDSLDAGLKRSSVCIQKGTQAVSNAIVINVAEQNVQCISPLKKVHEINKFVVLFLVYERCLGHIKEIFEKTQHLIDANQKKFISVLDKINDILKYRSAIETELIFVSKTLLVSLIYIMVIYIFCFSLILYILVKYGNL